MMASLADLQSTFMQHIANASPGAPDFVASPLGMVARRFGIYRNNVFAGLVGVMEDRFPATRRIVGDNFFYNFARQFVETMPPHCPALVFYGDAFADSIRAAPECDDVPYLGDIAAIEWEIHRCFHAADEPILQAHHLAQSGADPSTLTFRLAASSGLVVSEYPVYSIWRANTGSEPAAPLILAKVGESALITRLGLHCQVVPLPLGAAAFISQVAAGHTLADATAVANSVSSGFRLDQTLGLLLRQGALAAFAT